MPKLSPEELARRFRALAPDKQRLFAAAAQKVWPARPRKTDAARTLARLHAGTSG